MDDYLHHLLHTLWSKAVGQPHYERNEWIALEQAIFTLIAMTPPDAIEPPKWSAADDPLIE